jgi:hypothetical protein
MTIMDEKCKTCRFWQDWQTRIHARVTGKSSTWAGNVLELRACRNVPPPHYDKQWDLVYTDEDHGCSAWQSIK